MKNRLAGWTRYLALGCLWLLIALLAVPTMLAHWTGAGGLFLIEHLAAVANRLRNR